MSKCHVLPRLLGRGVARWKSAAVRFQDSRHSNVRAHVHPMSICGILHTICEKLPRKWGRRDRMTFYKFRFKMKIINIKMHKSWSRIKQVLSSSEKPKKNISKMQVWKCLMTMQKGYLNGFHICLYYQNSKIYFNNVFAIKLWLNALK